MATATTLKVKKADALKLCHALGFKDVDKWTDARLAKKVGQLNTVVDETTKVDKSVAGLLKSVVETLDEGGEIAVVEGKFAPEKSAPSAKPGKKAAKQVDEDEDEVPEADDDEDADEEIDETEDEVPEADDDEETDETEDEDEEPKKPTKKAAAPVAKPTKGEKGTEKKTGKPVATNAGGGKKPGIIATIIAMLKKGTEKKPVTKETILEKLIQEFPDRDSKAMKSTISSQVPSGLKAEKDITVKRNDKGFWVEDSNGY